MLWYLNQSWRHQLQVKEQSLEEKVTMNFYKINDTKQSCSRQQMIK